MPPIVLAEELGYRYRKGQADRVALEGLSFAVEAGEILGLLGPNGAGKTTAVRILTTILPPGRGRAAIGGHDVVREPLRARRMLAAVLQESAVETMLSAWDNLVLYGRLHGYDRARIEARAATVVDLLELAPVLRQRAHSLSGGFKRRLQVAKALMVETPVLFLDEATTGMDPLIKQRVMEAIQAQARQGRTVILTTQVLQEAEVLCDRLLLLGEGRPLASGKLAELRSLSRTRLRIELGFRDGSAEAIAALRALAPRTLEERNGEVHLQVEGSEDEWLRHMAGISERWPLRHLQIHAASLEQVFLDLYGRREDPP